MIGTVVSGRYRIRSRIGAGGAGEVYEADDLELPRTVAIKVLAPIWGGDRRQRQRFLREAQALSVLDHPHVCTIHTAGETEDGQLYIVMARYHGLDLRARLAKGDLTLQEAIACGIAVADGMAQAHRKGLLHRDLKPGNIVITEDQVVKILDFGLAKMPDRTQLTDTGVAMGTLAYISPEQAMGEALDLRTDIYSLGVILYQMVTGVCPFAAPSAAATLLRVLNEVPPPLSETGPDVPAPLARLIESMISKERDDRPANMNVVHDELLDILARLQPAQASRLLAEHVHSPEARHRPRRRWLAFAATLVLVVALAGANRLRAWLSPGPWPNGRGVAVLPARVEGLGEDDAILAAGLRLDLLDQVGDISGGAPQSWVLPSWWTAGVQDGSLHEASGAAVTLEASVRSAGAGPLLVLSVLDAESHVVIASQAWSVSDAVPQTRAWIAAALDLPDTAERPGFTVDPQAWLAYLEGRGLRESRTADAAARAVRSFDEALAQDPDFELARLYRGATLAGSGDAEGARLLEAEIDDPVLGVRALGLLASVRLGQRDYEQAAELLRQATERRLGALEYANLLGVSHQMRGEFANAEEVYRKVIALQPSYPVTYQYLGYLYYSRDQFDKAIDVYSEQTRLAPGYAEGWNQLGGAYYATDRWDEALECFQTSFSRGRTFSSCSNLGTLYYMRGEFEQAASMQELALQYDATNTLVMANLAASLRWIPGEEARADSLLSEAIRLVDLKRQQSPGDAVNTAILATLVAERDPGLARDLVEEALRIDADNAEVAYQSALACEEIGDRARALKLLGRAIEAGYSRRVIAQEKQLEQLRTDSRYPLLIQ